MNEDHRADSKPSAGAADPAAAPEEQWQLPDYAHERELGAGASGRVVLARHHATGTPVAIKYLSAGAAANSYASFRAEAELLGALRSPHVTRLYEYVEGPAGAAIVMELVDGITLRDLLGAEGATGPEAALVVLKGSLLGLAAAHEAGVVHRDYKPGNVLITADGESKLVDFGIAVRSGEPGREIAGTPAYMAPEQWAGQPASPATDVYAATATFFECLTGAKPYAGTTLMELAVQHTEAEIPDTHAPEALRPLIRAGLAKTPSDRPDGAEALVGELEAAAGAAYGEDWEERGRKRLAALVALLPLLLPFGGEQAAGATSLAHTALTPPDGGGPSGAARAGRFGRRAKLLSAAGALVLAGGALAGVASAGADASGNTQVGAVPEATTSFLLDAPPSGSPSASPTVSASPSASPSASASPSDSPSASASASASGKPTVKPTAAPTPTPTPTTAPTTSAPPPPVLHIGAMAVSLSCYGNYGATANVTVRSDGAADGLVTITWYEDNGKGVQKVLGSDTQTLPKGATKLSFRHDFSSSPYGVYWGARVSSPNATSTATATLLWGPTCNPPR